jgi:membrane dipeptidase
VLQQMAERGEDPRDWNAQMAAVARQAQTDPPPRVTVAQIADHIEHVRDVAGLAHVGIGADFDGYAPMPDELSDVSGYPRLVAELLDRHWSDAEIAALTCRNVLRVLNDARPAE